MIPQISEVNFPSYATLHQATINLADMGDKTITAQVKIDGAVRPSFVGTDGKDWEVEFRGERYIHPLREPQAKKDNSSVCSMIDLTFYHWAVYQMKRYFFVALANVDSGTPMVDKYIAPLAVNLPNFARAVADMLEYYFPDGELYVYQQGGSYINPQFTDYDPQTKYIEIDHSYIWDVLQKTYELFGCRWAIVKDDNDNYCIKFGYPLNTESSHIFKYGYDGGLLSVERQVQDDSIRNQLLGRGGSKNLPYMYFKDYERFHPNSQDSAYQNIGLPDPDAIPELENILFSELRDTNFRSYVQGWKVNPHRQSSTTDGWTVTNDGQGNFTESNGDTYSLDTERLETDWAYAKGATDEKFDPVEYVKDDESIATYGLLQGGLANDEDVFPTLQGMKLELPCIKGAHDSMSAGHDVETLADEVVDVEEVVTDVIRTGEDGNTDNQIREEITGPVINTNSNHTSTYANARLTVQFPAETGINIQSSNFTVPDGYFGNVIAMPNIWASASIKLRLKSFMNGASTNEYISAPQNVSFDLELVSWGVYDAQTNNQMMAGTNLPAGEYYVKATYNRQYKSVTYGTITHPNGVSEVVQGLSSVSKISSGVSAVNDMYNFDGQVIANTNQSGMPISVSKTIAANSKDTISLVGSQFHVPSQGAIMVECPVTVSPFEYAVKEVTLKILDLDSREYVTNSNIPEGDYEIRVDVDVTNTDSQASHEFTAELGPAFLYYNHDYEDWKPTFDIWIKNVFQTNRGDYASDDEYMRAVWEPLVSTQDLTVTFSTGNLSSHSDWEFKVASDGIHYDNSKTLVVKDENNVEHEIRSEWRLTLIKSDAEADSIHKYVPYKDFNAAPYDRFFFTNIYMPWAYVYAAEKLLNANKEAKLVETKEVQPTWVVKVDKVRMQELTRQNGEALFWAITPGDKVWVKDDRFTEQTGVQLYVESMSYNWQGEGAALPDLEIVLSDKVATAMTTVEQIQGDIKELSSQIKGLSQLERAIRAVGDAVYLRKDGFEDTSYSPTNIAKNISSANYRAGIVGGQGWSSYVDENGKGILEIDRLRVREEMEINNLVVNQVSSFGGKEILSAASMTISKVESTEDGFKCYFDQHQGSVGNLFVVGDIAMSQVWDYENQQTKYYRRAVVSVGADYIVLSYDTADGNGSPAVGDVVAQYGNLTDTSRQYVIIRDVIGGGYEQMLQGLNSVSATGSEYYFAGRQSGQSPRWFVGSHAAGAEYAEYSNGALTIKGTVIVKGSNNQYTDLGYLPVALPQDSTVISGGVVLSKLIGVLSDQGGQIARPTVVAAMNGSSSLADYYDESVARGGTGHGILMLVAGIPTTQGAVAKTDASTRIFEDGYLFTNHLVASGATISGTITTDNLTATGGQIGGLDIRTDGIGINSSPTGSSVNGVNIMSEFIIFTGENENSHDKSFVAIGSNVLPGTAASTALGRFELSNANGSTFEGHALMVSVSGFTENIACECGNGQFYGLRPKTRMLTSSGTLTEYDYNVFVGNSSSLTITLPDNPQEGQTFFLTHLTSNSFTVKSNSGQPKCIYNYSGSIQSSFSFSSKGLYIITFSWKVSYNNEAGIWIISAHTED